MANAWPKVILFVWHLCCTGERGTRTLKKENRQLCWFFTNRQLLSIVALFGLGVLAQIGNVAINLKFLAAQQAVQNGNMDMWEGYLVSLLVLSVFNVGSVVYMVHFFNTLSRYLQFNLFKKYQACFKVYEKGVLMKYHIIYAKLSLPLAVTTAVLGIFTIIKTMEMVTYNIQNVIVGIILLLVAMVCGVIRGKCESTRKKIDATIQEKKNDIVKFESFSFFSLNSALYVLDWEYRAAAKQSLRKVFFENLPRFLKQGLYVVLVWGLVNTLATGEVYSESYLILTAYGTILGIAEELGKIVEKAIEIFQLNGDLEVKKVDVFEAKENQLLEKNRGNVRMSEKGLEIFKEVCVDVKSALGNVRYYKLLETIFIPKGKHVILIGEKEVGKTRFLTFLKNLFSECVMIYNDASKIFNQWYDNFKNPNGFDCDIIRELAKGLKLQRFVNLTDDELKSLQITNINTGDKHLCVALVMLYNAIKNPALARLIVFDELLANIDEANSKEIMAFIMRKVNEIGSTVIFVGHTQQELIKSYCHSQIVLEGTEEYILVKQEKL